MSTVNLGGREVAIQPMSGRRAIRTAHVLKSISDHAPAIFEAMATFVRDYTEDHAIELDRARARFEFPDETAHLSEQDWESAGQKLTLPRKPSGYEITAAVFPKALDLAETQTLMLLAIGVTSNEEIAALKREGGVDAIDAHLAERGDQLLDEAMADELLELAAVMAETVQAQFEDKIADLSGRMRPLMRLLGLAPQTQPEAEQPTPPAPTPPAPAPEPQPTPSPTPAPDPTPAPAPPPAGSPTSSIVPAPTSGSGSGSPERSDGPSERPLMGTPGTN